MNWLWKVIIPPFRLVQHVSFGWPDRFPYMLVPKDSSYARWYVGFLKNWAEVSLHEHEGIVIGVDIGYTDEKTE